MFPRYNGLKECVPSGPQQGLMCSHEQGVTLLMRSLTAPPTSDYVAINPFLSVSSEASDIRWALSSE